MWRIPTLVLAALVLVGDGTAAEPSKPKPRSGYLEVDGSKIYYEERGSGPAVVFLHDGLLGAESWDAICEVLAGKYHVVRYDRRGYGRSEAPTRAFSPAEDLFRLLTHLDLQHAVVVGSSSGGALAIDFAIERPQMVDGLFLIGPVLHGMPFTEHFLARARQNSAPMERGDIKTTARNWSEDQFLIAGGHDQARRKFYDALVASPQNLKYDPQFDEKLSPPASQRLAEVKAPTIILAGESDIADVHAHCGAINTGIRESNRVVVKGVGHLIQLEKPDEVAKQLEEFMNKIKSRN